jgi:putative transposase
MPYYEYRHLSPQEREQIVQQRRERGYPLHSPPHPFRQAGNYFITGVNYEHERIMEPPERRTDFEMRLMSAMQEIKADVMGWVILPNHYHILIGVASLHPVSAVLQSLHGVSSREWNLADGMVGTRRVWYKFRDSVIRDEKHYYNSLNYIHLNPAKHGYVRDPYEWIWSSIHNYADAYGREWLREKWQKFPPGEFGKGWDD